jgi:hypothetical protein
MASHWGVEGTVKVGGVPVANIKNWKLDRSVTPVSSTAMGDTWETHIPNSGIKKWSGSMDCHWDEVDAGQAALTIGATVALTLFPEGVQSTDVYWSGTATVTAVGVDIKMDGETVGRSYSFQGSGALAELVVP